MVVTADNTEKHTRTFRVCRNKKQLPVFLAHYFRDFIMNISKKEDFQALRRPDPTPGFVLIAVDRSLGWVGCRKVVALAGSNTPAAAVGCYKPAGADSGVHP
jgi:hypothetical protein